MLGFGFGGMGLRTAEQEGRNECKERTGRMLREKGRRIGFDIGGRCDDDAVSLLLSLSRAGRLQGSNGFTLASHKKYWVGGKRERSPATPPSSSATSHVFIHFGQAFIWLDGYHFLIQSVSRVRGRKLPLVVGGGGVALGIFCVGEAARVPRCPNLCKTSSVVDEVSFMKLCAMYGTVVVWTRAHAGPLHPCIGTSLYRSPSPFQNGGIQPHHHHIIVYCTQIMHYIFTSKINVDVES